MPKIISNNEAFQKRGISINAEFIESGRVLAIDVFAPRAGWEFSFRKGPVVGFKDPSPFEKLTAESVFEGLSHFLVQHVRVADEKDVTERIEDVEAFINEPSAPAAPESNDDVLKVAEAEIQDLHERNEALTKEVVAAKGELEAAEKNIATLQEQITILGKQA